MLLSLRDVMLCVIGYVIHCVYVMCVDLLTVSVVNFVVYWSSDLGVLGVFVVAVFCLVCLSGSNCVVSILGHV